MATRTLSGVPQRRSSREVVSRPLDMAAYARAPVSVFNSNLPAIEAASGGSVTTGTMTSFVLINVLLFHRRPPSLLTMG